MIVLAVAITLASATSTDRPSFDCSRTIGCATAVPDSANRNGSVEAGFEIDPGSPVFHTTAPADTHNPAMLPAQLQQRRNAVLIAGAMALFALVFAAIMLMRRR